jgi:ubiquinone/menaquinone biosynthesis C-methylase UbiE
MSDDPNADAYLAFVGFYDVWTKDVEGDVDFYVRRASRAGGPVVELGAGTGRIAIPTAASGKEVIAVDLSAAMLAEARRRAADAGVSDRITFVEADMRSFVASPPVELVTIPYRSFLHMATTEDQLACLASVDASLRPGGRLILNMFVPDPAFVAGQDRRRNLHGEFTDDKGRRCELWVTPEYETTTQNVTIRAIVEAYEGDRHVESTESVLHVRMIYRYEMEHLLARSGFEVEALFGDFDERPLTEGCREMIWVARKPR